MLFCCLTLAACKRKDVEYEKDTTQVETEPWAPWSVIPPFWKLLNPFYEKLQQKSASTYGLPYYKYPYLYPTPTYPYKQPVPELPTPSVVPQYSSYLNRYWSQYPTQYPVQYPGQYPVQYPGQYPIQSPMEYPIEYPIEQLPEYPIQYPIDYPIQNPIEYPRQYPLQRPVPLSYDPLLYKSPAFMKDMPVGTGYSFIKYPSIGKSWAEWKSKTFNPIQPTPQPFPYPPEEYL